MIGQLCHPVHQRPVSNTKRRGFHLAGAHMSVTDERSDRITLTGPIRITVREVVVRTDEIRRRTVLLEHAQGRADSNCTAWESLQ